MSNDSIPNAPLPAHPENDDIAIRVSNLSKCYQIYKQPQDRLKQTIYPSLQRLAGKTPKQYYREFLALKDVSFEIKKTKLFCAAFVVGAHTIARHNL